MKLLRFCSLLLILSLLSCSGETTSQADYRGFENQTFSAKIEDLIIVGQDTVPSPKYAQFSLTIDQSNDTLPLVHWKAQFDFEEQYYHFTFPLKQQLTTASLLNLDEVQTTIQASDYRVKAEEYVQNHLELIAIPYLSTLQDRIPTTDTIFSDTSYQLTNSIILSRADSLIFYTEHSIHPCGSSICVEVMKNADSEEYTQKVKERILATSSMLPEEDRLEMEKILQESYSTYKTQIQYKINPKHRFIPNFHSQSTMVTHIKSHPNSTSLIKVNINQNAY